MSNLLNSLSGNREKLSRAGRDVALLVPAAVITMAAGAGVAARPAVGVAAGISLPFLALLITKPGVRLAAVVIGALVVFQSDSAAGKFGYVALAVLCCAVSLVSLGHATEPVVRCFRPLIPASILLLIMIGTSGLIATSGGVPASVWARESLSYVLLAVLPAVGIDAGRTIMSRHLNRYIAVLGVLCAAGFAVDWLDRRGVSGLSFGRLILATTVVPYLCFVYALSRANRGRTAVLWLMVAVVIASLLLITGSRSSLVMVFGLVGVVGIRKGPGLHPVRLIFYVTAMVAVVATLVPWLASHLISDPAFLNGRISQALAVVHGQASSDQSYQARERSYDIARQAWHQHLWLGAGPGGVPASDAPTLVLAKFGLLGAGALTVFAACLLVSVLHSRRLSGPQPIHVAARGWVIILVVATPFGPWTEDKGLALALAILLAAVVAQAQTASQSNDVDGHIADLDSGRDRRPSSKQEPGLVAVEGRDHGVLADAVRAGRVQRLVAGGGRGPQ